MLQLFTIEFLTASLGSGFMNKRKKGYLEVFIVVLIFLTIFVYFNLPKETLIIFGIIVIFNLIVFELSILLKQKV